MEILCEFWLIASILVFLWVLLEAAVSWQKFLLLNQVADNGRAMTHILTPQVESDRVDNHNTRPLVSSIVNPRCLQSIRFCRVRHAAALVRENMILLVILVLLWDNIELTNKKKQLQNNSLLHMFPRTFVWIVLFITILQALITLFKHPATWFPSRQPINHWPLENNLGYSQQLNFDPSHFDQFGSYSGIDIATGKCVEGVLGNPWGWEKLNELYSQEIKWSLAIFSIVYIWTDGYK